MKTSITQSKSEILRSETEKLLTISDKNLKQLRSIFQNAPAAIAIFNGSEHRFIMANLKYQIQNNRLENDLLGKTYHEVFPELNGTGAYELLNKVFQTGETFVGSEYSAIINSQNNGIPQLCYFNFSLEALKNESDEIYGVMIMVLDITEQVLSRKKIEENELEIRNIKEHLELSIKAGKIGVWNWDVEKNILNWNDEQKEMYGIENLEELNNLEQFQSFVIPEDWERIILNIQGENIKLNQEYDFRIKRKNDGEIRWIKSKSKVLLDEIGKIKFISGVNIDITEQEKARNKIEESKTYYHTLTDNTPVMIWMTRSDGYCTYLNKQWYNYTAQTKETGLGYGWLSAVHPDDLIYAEINFNNATQEQTSFTFDYRLKNKEGEYRWHKDSGYPQFDKQGNFEGLIGSVTDIHESVVNKKKIEESEQRFQAAVAAVQGVIWTNNAKGEMEGEQMGWGALSGQNYDEYQGYGWANVVHPDDVQGTITAWNEAVLACKHFVYEHRVKLKNEKWGHFSVKAIPILNEDGTIREWVGVHTDITEQKNVLQKIEETEYKYHNLIYTSPYMIAILKGKDMIVEIANNSFIETWGKGNDVIGKSFYDVLPEVVDQGFDELLLNVFESGESYNAYETPITLLSNGNQKLMYFNFTYQPHRNLNDKIIGVGVLANDVTTQVQDKMKIIESEERFRLLADNLPLSVFVVEPNNESSVTYLNKHWLEYTKQTFEEAIGTGWNDIVHPDDTQLIMDVFVYAFANRIPYSTPNIRIKRHDGVYRWFTFHGNPRFLNNGEFVGMIGAGFDITDQKLFELELIEEKTKAENAVQAKQQFLSNMSHEIRTPMNAIVGFTNVILKTELNDSQKQYLNAIKVSGDALVILINDILDLAKVDSGKMTFDKITFNLVECIHKITLLFKIKLKEKNLKFNLNLDDNIPIQIIGDPMRLRQIILNLLSNAIKFTDKGTISLDVTVLSHSKNIINIAFKISDTGIGIANENLESIFNNFEQAHADISTNYGGTGLGLAIVKKLVENQGGTIVTNSEIGKGSTFLFTLKFNTNNLENTVPKNTARKDIICQSDMELKNIKILVAEDVVLNQLLMKVVLGNFNFEVDIADNGKIAIEKIKTKQYDLVLMDLHMPEMNGFEATKHIREEMKSQIPIVALTADVTQVDIDKCLAIGMHDYISKPIDEALLYEKIVKVLNDNQK